MPICVVGMHRSGTSLLTQMLGRCGIHIGEIERVSGSDDLDNPTGYWEHPSFQRLNTRILDSIGASWKSPPTPRSLWSNVGSSSQRPAAFGDRP